MRVLLLAPGFPPQVGGIQLLLQRLASHLAADVQVVALDHRGDRSLESASQLDRDSSAPVRWVRTGRRGHQLDVAFLNSVAVWDGVRRRPDVVVSGHIVTAPAAQLLNHAFGVPYVQYVYAAEMLRRAGLARFAVSGAAEVLAISEYSASLARAAGASDDRIHVVHPGVDMIAEPTAQRDSVPTLVTVARVADVHKGHDVLLRAAPIVAERVPAARWVVVGDGPLLAPLRAASARSGAAGLVRFTGAISDADRDAWLDRAHAFVLPSREGPRGAEGFGIAYLEAALHGLPVVAGRTGGARDAVVDGVTGLLVDASDHVAVADAACRLLLDPLRARRLGDAGRERARGFTWERMAGQVLGVLTGVVERKHAA